MSTGSEKSSSNGQIFSRKKSLLTMQQYASTQGVSAGIVQECAKLGVVQVRKHKDRTYIVDLPLDIYKNIRHQDDQKPEPIDTSAQAQRISGLVNKIFQSDRQVQPLTIGRAAGGRSDELTEQSQFSAETAAIPDLNLFAQEENRAASARINKFDPVLGRFRIPHTRKIIDAVKTVSVWKIVSVVAIISLFASISAYWWVNADRKNQQQRLQQAYVNIQKLLGEYENARQKAKFYELDVINWQSESQKSRRTLADLQSELIQTKEKLFQSQKDLSATQQYNVETLKQLNTQIGEITTRIQQNPLGK